MNNLLEIKGGARLCGEAHCRGKWGCIRRDSTRNRRMIDNLPAGAIKNGARAGRHSRELVQNSEIWDVFCMDQDSPTGRMGMDIEKGGFEDDNEISRLETRRLGARRREWEEKTSW